MKHPRKLHRQLLPQNAVSLFNGRYYLLEDGTIYSSLQTGNKPDVLKRLSPNKVNGYYCINLTEAPKAKAVTLRVHRLVAQHFLPNPNDYPVVHHRDHDKLNNHKDNLEWCTYQHNTQEAVKAGRMKNNNKRSLWIVHQVNDQTEIQDTYESLTDAAEKLNVNRRTLERRLKEGLPLNGFYYMYERDIRLKLKIKPVEDRRSPIRVGVQLRMEKEGFPTLTANSYAEAARILGVPVSKVRLAVTKHETVKGYEIIKTV